MGAPGGSGPTNGPPNVVVIVLDCVRADDFAASASNDVALPFLNRLRRESVVYPRAASVAPWTVPAHASIFTGLYPWEHRAHAKGALPLDPGVPRLPALLKSAGYASLSLSANPLLNPELGLVSGFDAAAWSEWWEPYVRNSPRARRPRDVTNTPGAAAPSASRLQRLHDSPLVSVLHRSADLVYRYPFALSAFNHLLQKVTMPEETEHALVARWLTPTFGRWLGTVPARQPIFTFVNLLEAHEPYFVDRSVIHGLREYLQNALTWQDRPSVLSGRWSPTSEELTLLRALYRSTFRLVEMRVRSIVELLVESGRWENTLFVLTSDHGQAFLENGTLFHMHRPDEELLRVPLWVRYPGGELGGRTARGWASLVDIAPTVLERASVPVPTTLHGVPLPSILDVERPGPVFAMADGLALSQERRQIGDDRMAWIDRLWAAAYEENRKVTVDLTDSRIRAYDLESDPTGRRDLWPTEPGRFESLATEARRVAERLSGGPAAEISEEVEDRLRSWGYV